MYLTSVTDGAMQRSASRASSVVTSVEQEEPLLTFAAPARSPAVLTARWSAAARARETSRSDSLFSDEFAHRLAGEEGWEMDGSPASRVEMVRTCFVDKLLRTRHSAGCTQIVLLGAGMDARAFRMRGMEDACFFEVDMYDLFTEKEAKMARFQPSCARRVVIEADLADPSTDLAEMLISNGFQTAHPTMWILEGLIYYLSSECVARTMALIGSMSAPGSTVFHDAVSASFIASGGPFIDEMWACGVPWLSGHDNYRYAFSHMLTT